MPPKKKKPPEGGLRRSRSGLVLVRIREEPGAPLSGRFTASTVGAKAKDGPGAYQAAFGCTPLEACDLLSRKLAACGYQEVDDLETADAQSAKLLGTPWKRPGQNPGGAPRKREEAATERFTFRLPPSLKRMLVGMAELDGITPAQMALDALEQYFAVRPKTRRRSTQ